MRSIRISVPAFLALLLVAFHYAGCSHVEPGNSGKLIVILVDRSQSTKSDRELYAKACERVLSGMQPGDRLVAGYITDRSAADFDKYLDEELPPPLPSMKITDIPSQYKKKKSQWDRESETRREEIRRRIADLLAWQSSAARTKIFESLRVASQLIASERRPNKQLILLSDMVEDSEIANFEKARLDEAFVQREISRQQAAGMLPNLRGVRVYVAGAHADSLERGAAIEKFWLAYFAAAGAVLDPGWYSRTIPRLGD
jgi:hypothetical protein